MNIWIDRRQGLHRALNDDYIRSNQMDRFIHGVAVSNTQIHKATDDDVTIQLNSFRKSITVTIKELTL